MRQIVVNHLKNIQGWKTDRKLLAFAVDDYGNVRLASRQAIQNLKEAEIKLKGRFDEFDALDTKQDYDSLFNVLKKYNDKMGKHPVFSTYALPCNINFEASLNKKMYIPENLDSTYKRMAVLFPEAYEGAFEMMLEGVKKSLLRPQFHGREHLNTLIINKLFEINDSSLLTNLENLSMAGISQLKEIPNISFTQAFAFNDLSQTTHHDAILIDGLTRFKEVYGYRSLTFTPPSQEFFTEKYPLLEELGVIGIHKGRRLERKNAEGEVFIEKAKTGVLKNQKHVSLVRNVVFEPTDYRGFDWVNFTIKQIEAAFFWNKPAIISSHRVNFCGHISESNREVGLAALNQLFKIVLEKFPDVEFVGIDELTDIIWKENEYSNL